MRCYDRVVRSGWSVGIVMIVVGGLGIGGVGVHPALGTAGWSLAVLLIASGTLLFLRRVATFYLAVFSSVVLAATGIAALSGHPELALPMPPPVSLVVGLYLCARLFIARASLVPRVRSDDGPPE